MLDQEVSQDNLAKPAHLDSVGNQDPKVHKVNLDPLDKEEKMANLVHRVNEVNQDSLDQMVSVQTCRTLVIDELAVLINL